jgi:hypothetical protein
MTGVSLLCKKPTVNLLSEQLLTIAVGRQNTLHTRKDPHTTRLKLLFIKYNLKNT